MVAHQTGGLGVASSSLVTPTIGSSYLKGFELFLFIRKNGLNRAYSDFLRISKSLSKILKMHQYLHQNQKSCTKSAPKNQTKIRIKDYVYSLLSQKITLPCKFKTGLIFCCYELFIMTIYQYIYCKTKHHMMSVL